MRLHSYPCFGTIGLLAALAACGSPSTSQPPPEPVEPAAASIVSGDLQTVVAGGELPQALRVRVTDGRGRPMTFQVVAFSVVTGGGSMLAGFAKTNLDGVAEDRWRLGTTAGDTQRVEARVIANSGSPTTVVTGFRAVALPDVPHRIDIHGGYAQTDTAGQQLPDSLAVLVRDRHGNVVPGATVTWFPSGAGKMSPDTSYTNAAGIARSAWTLAPNEGNQSAAASLTAAPATVVFQATALHNGLPPEPPGVTTDSARIAFNPMSGGNELRALGALTWRAGQNPLYWVEWGPSATLGSSSVTYYTRADSTSLAVDATFKTAYPGDTTVYHFRLVASNQHGVTRGAIRTFQWRPPPAPSRNTRQ